MKKNDMYEITIEDIGNDGEGIGHIHEATPLTDAGQDDRGIAVFVKDTVVGDVARIRIVKVKKSYAYGRLEEIITPSPYRVEAVCSKARSCGGCSLMHMSYEKQLEYKWNKVKNCLERIGGLTDAAALMEPICGMEQPYHYRNKMQFPVGLSRDGKVEIGFFAGRTHSIIDLEQCAIGHPLNDYIIRKLRPWLQRWQDRTGAFIYDEASHTGLVRHILTRVGFATGELMVCLVINGESLETGTKGGRAQSAGHGKKGTESFLPQVERELLDCLHAAVDEYNAARRAENTMAVTLTGVSININRDKTNRILGDTCKTLWGQGYISDYIGDIRFKISPLSFYQVNPVQTKVLYDKAVSYAGLTGNETVWDMYCGIGTISLCLAKHAKRVFGVEIVPQAIEDAKENARINNITNATFFCGKAEEVVPKFYNGVLKEDCPDMMSGETYEQAVRNRMQDGRHPDVVVVDPPRKGCDSVLLDTIAQMAPERLVYVSCDPATLARDVKILAEKGYVVRRVGIVDQFGHSSHVETVVMLSHKKPIA